MFKGKLQKMKKAVVIVSLVFLFLIPTVSGVILFAKPAAAQFSVPLLETLETKEEVDRFVDKQMGVVQSTWWVALTQAVFNAVSYFSNKIAYDMAVALATASPGQTPTFFTQDWGSYLTETALDSAGEGLGSLSEIWSSSEHYGTCAGTGADCFYDADCGRVVTSCEDDDDCSTAAGPGGKCDTASNQCVATCVKETAAEEIYLADIEKYAGLSLRNLCVPPDPQIRLDILTSLAASAGEAPAPKCEWSNIEAQWDTFTSEASTDEILSQIGVQFKPGGGSTLDIAFQSQTLFSARQAADEEAATADREEGDGFKPLSEMIAPEFFKTPAQLMKDQALAAYDSKEQGSQEQADAMNQALSPGALVGQNAIFMAKSLLSTFINTLSSKLLNRVMQEGLVSLKDVKDWIEGDEDVLGNPEFAGVGGRAAAEATYADFITPRPKEMSEYSPLIELAACPQGVPKAPENCAIDAQFVQAVNQATMGDPLTVGEAIEKGLLHGEWPLISSDNSRNEDPFCFQTGYCYSNLTKLRKYRIIPIGWEIAANLSDGTERLQDAIDNFNSCDPTLPESKRKWCHLIDPNWILKAPAHQCRARVFGAVSNEGIRQETCVDAPSCISENDQGTCDSGYGYCVTEKNIWRLEGDKCDAQFDSCRALKSRTGETKSYLINTVEYGPPCSADDVGCRWYSTYQTKVGDEWNWQDRESGGEKTDRIYFNKNVAQCDEAGCSQFYKTGPETSLNLLQNSSFENFAGDLGDDTVDIFENWSDYGDNSADGKAMSGSYLGTAALGVTENLQQIIETGRLLGGRIFTLSLYAKNCGGRAFFSSTPPSGPGERSGDISLASGAAWERKTGSLSFPLATTHTALSLRLEGAGPNCQIDAVQLEEANEATAYHDGWAGLAGDSSGNTVTYEMKKAPEYLMCYNYNPDGTVKTSDDSPDCGNFSAACEENEAGCEQYTPVTGGPPVPGIATYPDDYCRAECVGYQTFKQLETNFEQDKFPVFFIPRTGRTCSASEAGCDEFTSLETEAVENYSYLRQCQKPGADEETFYTWEGSDTTGYQLKTWILKKSRFIYTSSPLPGSDPDPTGDAGTESPCVKAEIIGGVLTCVDDGIRFEDEARALGFCTKDDTVVGSATYNPDCREFYDREGLKHYRLYSKTIVATDDCHPYRKTLSTETDCQNSGGAWDPSGDGRAECIYQVYPAESRSCSAVGCRAYRGNTGANVRNVFQNNFDADLGGWTGADQSSESLATGGHSMRVTGGTVANKPVASEIQKGGVYLISFWARTEIASGVEVKFSNSASPTLEADIALTWQPYTLGPIEVTWDPAVDETINIELPRAVRAYFDNFILKQVSSNIYLVKDSWVTPTSCDQTAFGGYLPQAMLGCEEYRDRDSRQHFLKSFTNLCREEAIGCQKLVDTKNTDSPYEQTFNAVCKFAAGSCGDATHPTGPDRTNCACEVRGTEVCAVLPGENSCRYDADERVSSENKAEDTVVTPADSYTYLIVDSAKFCNPSEVGCTSYGAPKLDSAGSIICTLSVACSPTALEATCECERDGEKMCDVPLGGTSCTGDFETVNFLNDETHYTGANRILCVAESQSCEEYTGTDSTKFYFKDPGKRTCAWKEKVTYGGEERSGWWRKDDTGTDVPCYADYSSAGVFGIWKNADTGHYDEWVGVCPAEQNLCTKFVDPSDTSGENPDGAPYYYLKNNKLGEGNCGGMVSLQAGCVLFNDTSSLSKIYNAQATYAASDTEGGNQVSPVDCKQSGGTGFCKRCTKTVGGTPEYGDYCTSSEECVAAGWTSCTNYVKDDANTILEVRRDRVCGEWITCESSTPVWDSFANRFKTVCDGLNLCSELKKVGQASECSNWVGDTEIPEILDIKKYTSRDITWKGKDYSGYAIPNQFQAFKLSQVNVAAAALDEEADWRLGLVEDAACFGARIPLSTAYEDFPGPTDADWSTPFVARECATGSGEAPGACYAQNGKLCDVPATTESSARHGKCYNMKCVYAPEGTQIAAMPPFAEAKPLEKETKDFSPDCRAYPESNSPFPESVNPETGRKQGFSNANVCEDDDNACECSYRKISYSGTVKYYDNEKFADQIPLKICAGGSSEVVGKPLCDGDPCTLAELSSEITLTDADCTDASGSVALKQKIDTVLGLEGYCLEKDKTTHINGSESEYACLSWLPVDRLMGAPDIYNQYTRAGYLPNGKENYCLEPELYKEFRPVDTSACFDADEEYECDPDDMDACRQKHCPEGFVTIIGACQEWGSDCVGDVYDDCPYKCIPLESRHTRPGSITDGAGRPVSWQEGELCFPEGATEGATQFSYYPNRTSDPRPQLTSWLDSGSYAADALYSPDRNYRSASDKRYDDCELRGAPLSAPGAETVGEDYFAGCKTVAKIVDADGIETKAWTNRLWESADPLFRISTSPERAVLSYMQRTPETPFGYTIINPDDANNYWPAVVPVCLEGSSGAAQWHWFLPEATPGDDPIQCPPIPSDPTTHYDFKNRDEDGNPVNESRPYTFIETEARSISGDYCADDAACNSGVSCEVSSFLCYKQCDLDADCAAGICDTSSVSVSGYCPDETIAEIGRACEDGGGAWLSECSGGGHDGEKCETDSFCWDRSCQPNIYFPVFSRCGPAGGRISTPPLSVTSTSREDLAIGLARLQQIFAKIYKVYIWDSNQLKYNEQSSLPSPPAESGYDVTEVGIGEDEPTPPEVHPLGRCADGKCSPDEDVEGISVNGKNSGTVISRDGSLKASIKFFFNADAEQMPIKSVCVDFAGIGDARFMSAGCGGGDNFYKNSYGWNTDGSSKCNSDDFGHAPRACSELYYTSETTFTCSRPLAGSAPLYWRDTCPDPTVSGPCCVFTPRVQVKDNWGWCNGTCASTPGDPRPNGGCYGEMQCDIFDPAFPHWTAFNGRVIVVPK
jgi:hypothetical protein